MHKRKLAQPFTKGSKEKIKKYSLDSDEEDSDNNENVLDENEIEGEEEGVDHNVGEERFTAFNMQEEMQEGHFDADGHFIWKNEKDIRDNWLENIDWQRIHSAKKTPTQKGLGDEDSDDSSSNDALSEIDIYKQILTYLKPKETIARALQRLGNKKKLSSIERIRLKKAGQLDTNESVIELTEFANRILTRTGNMDIYQETYEQITAKVGASEGKHKKGAESLDMYADDFGAKEQVQLEEGSTSAPLTTATTTTSETMWELKWEANTETVEGPHTSQKMKRMADEGRFAKGAWVRKRGETTTFYSANRIDFDLYL